MKEIGLATMAAKAYGMDHFVRLPATDYALVMRPLEAHAGGADGSAWSARQAGPSRQFAGQSFWPRGERGLNGGNGDCGLRPLPEHIYMADANAPLPIQNEEGGGWLARGGSMGAMM